MKGTIPVVFLVVLLSVVGTVALSSTYMLPAVISPSSLAGPTSTSETNPQTALEFAMALNSSSASGRGVLGVSLSLFNTLGRTNNVTGAQYWRVTNESENSGSVGWNCAQNDVFRIEVTSGYYGLNNFSNGRPLDVFVWQSPFAFNQCLYYVRSANDTAQVLTVSPYDQNYYIFRPSSNAAWWVTSSELAAPCLPSNGTYHPCNRPGQAAVMSETMILKTGLFASSPGIFTVVGGDEWGDLEVLHFYVGSGASQETNSSETCTLAITLTQTGANATTTQVVTLCHKQSTYSISSTATATITTTNIGIRTSSATQEYATVAGDVSVGPAFPVCQAGKSCNVNMTGYAIGFKEQDTSSETFNTLTYNGSFSVELTPGEYTVNLYYCKGTVFPTDCVPSCPWLGCSSFYVNNKNLQSFPIRIFVAGGQTAALDINISTGIA